MKQGTRAAIGGMVVLVLALACGSGDEGSGSAEGGQATRVKVLTVEAGPLERSTTAVGDVEALHTVLLQPETSGVVTAVRFEDGQAVKKGDLLVKLRDDAARAQLADAEARHKLAQAQLERIEALLERGNTSRQELDQATAQRDLAQAAVALARDAVRRTEIRAPFDGVLGRREVSVGATVSPTSAVTRIEDLSTVVVDISLTERALPDLAVGQPVHVTIDAWPDRKFEGTLAYVAPRVDEATRTLGARVQVDNADGLLRPGLSARVAIVTSQQPDAVLVPTEAVVTSAQGSAVFVAGPEQKAEMRPVRTGVRDDSRVEILEGVNPGDRIIVEGLLRMYPGAAIEVVPDDGAAGGAAGGAAAKDAG